MQKAYSNLGFLSTLTNVATGAAVWQAQSVNAWGKLETELNGAGVQTARTYDPKTGRLIAINAGTGGNASNVNIQHAGLAYDSLANVTSRTDNIGSGSSGAVTESYTFDLLNRLSGYQVASASIPNQQRTVTLEYSAIGNLLYKSDLGVYAYPASGAGSVRPHAVSSVNGVTYNYDADGNLISASGGKYRSVSYNSFDMPDGSSGVLMLASM